MPVNISLDSNTEALSRAGIFLKNEPEKIKIAVSHAVNRSLESFKTINVRETASKYFVKQKDVRDSMKVQKSSGGDMHGAVVSRGKRHLLADYKISPTSPKSRGKTEIKGAVKREGGLKKLRDKPFMVKRAGGKYFPFFRVGYRREARKYGDIRAYVSPSFPQIVKNKETVAEAEKKARETFENRLEHELKRVGALP